ncbi:hypothetical protein CXB77_01735 [Chromatium okenii]|uniref:Uncharacterized protein n=1 Tax=Chromatium okenii TaxID=61644 RepID=A0A2S7XUW6_9GAMM|nr:hypothetical protein CXB77_01735 [Chromatium okenii]
MPLFTLRGIAEFARRTSGATAAWHSFTARLRAQLPADWAQFAGAATGQLSAVDRAGRRTELLRFE